MFGKEGRPPQEVMPVFSFASQVDEFFRSGEEGQVVNVFLSILGILCCVARVKVKVTKVLQDVIEDLANIRESRVSVLMEEGGEESDAISFKNGGVVEDVGGRHSEEKVGEFWSLKK